MTARRPHRLPVAVAILAAAACVAAALIYAWRAPVPTQPVAGLVQGTEIRIAPEITGRLASVAVSPGQHVRKGDVLAVVDNPDLAAAVGEARAAAAAAKADRDRVYSGTRAEEVAIAAQNVLTAEADLLLAQQQNVRAVVLSARDFGTRQQLDESTASVTKAQADLDLKRAQYAAANVGPTPEERALADAKVALSQASLADIQAKLDKTNLIAPVDGVVGILVAQPGEIIAPGEPVMTMETDGERWFTFTLREDALQGMALGATLALTAEGGRRIDARVTELRPLGEFATWRAARAVGDHDLNSFRLRLDPVAPDDALQPGMSVWLQARS